MAQNSKIEWTHHTANLWHGCTKVHAGCDNCYAEALSHRWGNDVWGNDKPRKAIKSVWSDLLKYQAIAADKGEIHRVFVGSMMDIFEKPMPVVDSKNNPILAGPMNRQVKTDELRDRFFYEIIPSCPNLMFLLLTKRPSNINKYIPEAWKTNPPENVMFGTSPVDQPTFDTLVRQLESVNGKRFLSIEPQLAHIDFYDIDVDWVIQGGESGHHKRPFNLDWAYHIRHRCFTLGIPYFFKQIDKVQEIPEDLQTRQFPVSEQEKQRIIAEMQQDCYDNCEI